jgi:hypothetical protein
LDSQPFYLQWFVSLAFALYTKDTGITAANPGDNSVQ